MSKEKRTASQVGRGSKQKGNWLPVVGYEELYEVSDLGEVRRVVNHRTGERNRVLKPGTASNGYPTVSLCKDSSPKTRCVHTLVLEAFIGPRPVGYECRHKDGIRANSRLVNLHWGTPSSNQRDRTEHGTDNRGSSQGLSKLSIFKVWLIRRMLQEQHFTQKYIARIFEVHPGTISEIHTRKIWGWLQ